MEVENWKAPGSKKLVEPLHPPLCGHPQGRGARGLYEACKYLGVKPDLYDNNEEQVKATSGASEKGGGIVTLQANPRPRLRVLEMMHTASAPCSPKGLVTSLAWGMEGKVDYVLRATSTTPAR